MKRILLAASAATLTLGSVLLAGGVASAKAHGGPLIATGTTVCNFHGSLSAPVGATASLNGNITPKRGKACSNVGGTKLRTGHLGRTPLASATTTTGVCTLIAGATLPDLTGGTITWSPRPKVAASTGVALTGGAVTVVSIGSASYLQIAYSGGSVASGSFANASGFSLTATSDDTVAALSSACAAGPVASISVHGSLTL